MSIDEAEHHADEGRFECAWSVIDDLPPGPQVTPRALRVRLRCCTGLARWEMGSEIAALLADGDQDDRLCAARFYHELAVAHLQDGDKREARMTAAKAVDAWKPARIELLEDHRLAGLF